MENLKQTYDKQFENELKVRLKKRYIRVKQALEMSRL